MKHENIKPKQIIGFLWKTRKDAPVMVATMITAQIFFIVLSSVIAPIFVAKLLALISSGDASWATSNHLLLFYALTLISGDVILARLTLLFIYLGETKMQKALYKRIFDNISNKDLRFHSDNMSGEVISNATKLINALENFWDLVTFSVTVIVTTFVAVSIALLIIFWQYALVVMILTSIFAIVIAKSQVKIAPSSREASRRSSKITGHFADVVTNISAVKAFAGEESEKNMHDKVIGNWRQAVHKEMWQVLKVTTVFSTITTLLNVVAFVVAILAAHNGVANIGTIYLMVSYTLSIVEQLWMINRVTRNYVRILGNSAPMIAMLEAPVTIVDDDNPEDVNIRRGGIRFRNVKFFYPDNKQEILFNDLNLNIKPGQKIGLVGKSGGGKTTLSKLLLRFIDISDGQILIDNQDIRRIRQSDLRSKIAYVPQEPLLFHRSVSDNISYGQSSSTQQQIEAVAKMAHANEFIADLPKGYDTLVGERGVKLSGGQRQRIAIARAMLKNAPILVLDEATSALDSESEALIQDALWRLMENRTAIVIAHRLSTIQQMDQIIVLDNGKITEKGSHKELIDQNSTYANLWNRQSGGFIED